jgi:SAM-dependent methyltransferase
MSDPRTQLVAAGYDAMPDAWEAFRNAIHDDPREEWLGLLLERLPRGARIVELGCGNGTRETAALAAHGELTGVDLSAEQLRRARSRVPNARYLQGDLASVSFDAASVDAVAIFYVLNHVPRDLLPVVLGNVHTWLRPGGLLLASLGVGDIADSRGEWLGVEMYFSSFPAETNLRLLRDAGFELVRDDVVAITEPEGPVEFQWVLARKPEER